MTPGLPLALGAMACFGVSDIIYKRGAAAGIKAGDFLMAQAWIFCPGVTLFAWLSGNLDLHLSAPVQEQLLKPPYDAIPTNAKVKLDGAITKALAKSQDDLAKVRTIDWAKINPQRAALIDRFNREIKL